MSHTRHAGVVGLVQSACFEVIASSLFFNIKMGRQLDNHGVENRVG